MILAAGMSPAWQQILEFDALHVGRVNRAIRATWCASGKVLNVGRALHVLGTPSRTLCAVGGTSGDSVRREFELAGIPAHWIDTGAPTRVCTTVLDRAAGETTELVENAAPCRDDVFDRFASAFADEVQSAELVVVTGSFPQNAPAGFVRRLLSASGAAALLDIRGADLLQVLDLHPFLIKPNRHELGETVGRRPSTDADLLIAMREMNQRGATWVVISDGGRALWASSQADAWRIEPPEIALVNPIGCGDCLTAGIADGVARRLSFIDALRWGVAVAAANAEQIIPARFDVTRAKELFAGIAAQSATRAL
jgi:1-phosphofructokinase family hexose kinase